MEREPDATMAWWFLPARRGRFEDMMSSRGHTDAVRRATFDVR